MPCDTGAQEKNSCYRCGRTNHSAADCKFKDAECHHCGKKGHIAPVCRSKGKPQQRPHLRPKPTGTPQGGSKKNHRRTHHIHEPSASDTDASSGEEYHLHNLEERSSTPINVQVLVNGQQLTMELDTGAAIFIISEETRKPCFADQKLRESSLVLKTYTGEPMQVVGQLNVRVKYGTQEAKLVLVVVGGNGPSLFGRNWLKYLRLDWSTIAAVRTVRPTALDTLMKQHQQLFADELGTVEPYKATLQVQPDATPRFFKPRPVPFAIKASIGKELDRLEQQGIIEKVSHSEWATPIVAVYRRKTEDSASAVITRSPLIKLCQWSSTRYRNLTIFSPPWQEEKFSPNSTFLKRICKSNWMRSRHPTSRLTLIRACIAIRGSRLA